MEFREDTGSLPLIWSPLHWMIMTQNHANNTSVCPPN